MENEIENENEEVFRGTIIMGNFRKFPRIRFLCTKCGRSYYKRSRQYYEEEDYRCKHCQEMTLVIQKKPH